MARNENGPGFSLKDELFNETKVEYLADLLAKADTSFDRDGFVQAVMKQMLSLELKARVAHITDCLERYLDADYKKAVQHIVAALPAPLDPTKTDDDFGDFIFAPLGEYVARHGVTKERLVVSLAALRELTQRFSMEDAIRRFIDAFPEETFAELELWSKDQNYHVRRLASEGSRPLLPWSARLSTAVERPLSLLDTLHADKTRYVTRSVANHLNDIAKLKPELVIMALGRWQKFGAQTQAELGWMIRHSLRTLIKQGNADALLLLGYKPDPRIQITNAKVLDTVVKVGEAAKFSFLITAESDELLMIDYVMGFMKANGKTKPKVHKLKALTLKKGEAVTVTKKHVFKAGSSTTTYYPGEHTITLQINGQHYDQMAFTLTT